MRIGFLAVPFLALVLSASDAPGQIKKIPSSPVQNTAEETQPKAEEASSADAFAIRDRRSEVAHAIRQRMGTRQSLRELYLLKELLDPPVSLR